MSSATLSANTWRFGLDHRGVCCQQLLHFHLVACIQLVEALEHIHLYRRTIIKPLWALT